MALISCPVGNLSSVMDIGAQTLFGHKTRQQQDQVSYQSKTHRTILAAPHIWRVRANDVIRALDSGMPAGS